MATCCQNTACALRHGRSGTWRQATPCSRHTAQRGSGGHTCEGRRTWVCRTCRRNRASAPCRACLRRGEAGRGEDEHGRSHKQNKRQNTSTHRQGMWCYRSGKCGGPLSYTAGTATRGICGRIGDAHTPAWRCTRCHTPSPGRRTASPWRQNGTCTRRPSVSRCTVGRGRRGMVFGTHGRTPWPCCTACRKRTRVCRRHCRRTACGSFPCRSDSRR